jgi:hypothetical protein
MDKSNDAVSIHRSFQLPHYTCVGAEQKAYSGARPSEMTPQRRYAAYHKLRIIFPVTPVLTQTWC